MGFRVSTSATAAKRRCPRQVKYILVNYWMPSANTHCALCGRELRTGYVHELETNLFYCDPQCWSGLATSRVRALERRVRRVL
jgi:hypothetical protein